MATIVYLDADDEITSAANRIRQADDTRVALVIPFGSRVATSRINFKLLAREAMVNGRRLDIVAPDASARALAASAGLPVFGSVGEYEAALDAPVPTPDEPAAPPAAAAAGLAAAAASSRRPPRPPRTARDRVDPVPTPSAGSRSPRHRPIRASPRLARRSSTRSCTAAARSRWRSRAVGASARGSSSGSWCWPVALVAAGAAAYLVLPSAEITITPQIEDVGPIDVTVRADPAATAVDEAAGVIPALTVDIPVEVSGEFTATGKRTETTPATGGVRWKNCDPSASYTIPRGTIVRTSGGIAFTIDEAVFLPVAVISGTGTKLDLKCQTSEVAVTAVKEGPAGNVDAGTIRIVPARYNRTLITVTNPAATTGGTREEFTRVSKKDVEAALATLEEDLQAQFQLALENPEGVPAGATVFPETAVLGEPAPDRRPRDARQPGGRDLHAGPDGERDRAGGRRLAGRGHRRGGPRGRREARLRADRRVHEGRGGRRDRGRRHRGVPGGGHGRAGATRGRGGAAAAGPRPAGGGGAGDPRALRRGGASCSGPAS